ncbi:MULTISPECIES: SDR family NAD(P)-dependent oxidoreductase [unclassified Sphingobium]|uniref:SDR family NAD(P)-dependent oxidoreductase n=1 Tax=unclassified Sphingobium TaxID=2611147 RepID=UPI0034285B35
MTDLRQFFAGKVVLIVGASSGMGRIFARRIAAEKALVAATARRAGKLETLVQEITAGGGTCAVFPADAQDEEAAAQVVRDVVSRFGRIDVVVLNAGGAPAIDMRRMNAAEVKAYMRSNYDVVVNYLFPVLDQMRTQMGGLVVHTNSLAGLIGVPLQGPYSAAKGGAKLLIDTCRIEFAQYGIRFLTVYPGFVATEATVGDGMPSPMEISEEKAVDHILHAIRKGHIHYPFPWRTAALTRLALMLPVRVRDRILARELPALADGK